MDKQTSQPAFFLKESDFGNELDFVTIKVFKKEHFH